MPRTVVLADGCQSLFYHFACGVLSRLREESTRGVHRPPPVHFQQGRMENGFTSSYHRWRVSEILTGGFGVFV